MYEMHPAIGDAIASMTQEEMAITAAVISPTLQKEIKALRQAINYINQTSSIIAEKDTSDKFAKLSELVSMVATDICADLQKLIDTKSVLLLRIAGCECEKPSLGESSKGPRCHNCNIMALLE